MCPHSVSAPTSGTGPIPVIDIGPLRDGSDPLLVAQALHRASHDVGFLYVSNHGIDPALLDDARSQALEFFRQPQATKQAVAISPRHRGFLAQGTARMHDGARPDLKESLVWGYEDDAGHTPEDHALRGANRWPAHMPLLRRSALAFSDQADQVARHLLCGFALGLNLDPGFFLTRSDRPMSRAAFVYYPPQPPTATAGDAAYGVAPHTDFGVLTVLCQDDVGGLEVQDARGRWVAAPPIPGTLVVNVGDLLARWTRNACRSTPHRVVNRSGRERLSLVLAFDPNPETPVDPRQVFGNADPADEPITCGDYLEWRFAKSFDYRGKHGAARAPLT
ncbi:MAG: isopenicillin N synthase family oxygenase [Rhodoferax sp.]|nr:isopenicillin N synthase family oxygenase [Rhodoferax sp.]